MGKQRREKKGTRTDPIFAPSALASAQEEEEHQTLPTSDSIPPILSKLDSLDEFEREWACSAVANMVLEPEAMKILLDNDVTKKLMERLIDQSPLVQVAAAGALRNIAVEGGESTCQEMLRKDILTPVLFLFSKAVEMMQAIGHDASAELLEKRGVISKFLEQLLVILWCLCEHFDKAIDFLTEQDGFFAALFSLLHSQAASKTSLLVAAAQFLNTITEDNPRLSGKIGANQEACKVLLENTSVRSAQGQEDSPVIRVLFASIVFNLGDTMEKHLGRSVLTVVVPVVAQILKVSLAELIVASLAQHPTLAEDQPEQRQEEEEEEAMATTAAAAMVGEEAQQQVSPWRLAQARLFSTTKSQQLALELLTNVCSENKEQEEVEEVEDWDAMEGGEVVEEMEEDQDSAQNEVFEMIEKSPIIIQLALEKCEFMPAEVCQTLVQTTMGKQVLRSHALVQQRALWCINNMAQVLRSERVGGFAGWWDRLIQIGVAAFSLCSLPDPQAESSPFRIQQIDDVLEPVTSACAALARKQPLSISEQQGAALREWMKSSSEAVRMNCVAIIQTSAGLNPPVVTQFLKECLRDPSPWVLAESVNAFFDIFADKDRNDVFYSLQIPQALEEAQKRLEQMKKGLPRSDRDLTERLGETLLNLRRFITFKKKEK